MGVYYAATALEGQLCRNATVVVAGSGNSAGQAAMFLSEGAAKVLLVVRGNNIESKMSTYLSRRVEASANIEILCHTEIRKMSGGKKLEEIELENTKTGERRVVRTPAVFSMIGAKPCTEWLPPEIERDAKGFIKTGHERRRRTRLAGEQTSTRPTRNQPPGNLCRGRCPLRLGQTLRRRRRRRRHGDCGRANEIGAESKLNAANRVSLIESESFARHMSLITGIIDMAVRRRSK